MPGAHDGQAVLGLGVAVALAARQGRRQPRARSQRRPRTTAASTSRGSSSGNAAIDSANSTRPPIANTSDNALAAAIAPNVPGSSTSGGKKSSVPMMARLSEMSVGGSHHRAASGRRSALGRRYGDRTQGRTAHPRAGRHRAWRRSHRSRSGRSVGTGPDGGDVRASGSPDEAGGLVRSMARRCGRRGTPSRPSGHGGRGSAAVRPSAAVHRSTWWRPGLGRRRRSGSMTSPCGRPAVPAATLSAAYAACPRSSAGQLLDRDGPGWAARPACAAQGRRGPSASRSGNAFAMAASVHGARRGPVAPCEIGFGDGTVDAGAAPCRLAG